MVGVFLSRGMTVGVDELSIELDDDGQVKSKLRFKVHFDVCPTWIELACGHLRDAAIAKADREVAWATNDEGRKASTLEREFAASMQAIVASATAIDAFYAALRPRAGISVEQRNTWRNNKTARYAQVAEVIKRAFVFDRRLFEPLRGNLQTIYQLRDRAVHPKGEIERPVLHPELKVGVEWRFHDYRWVNAAKVVHAAHQMLKELATAVTPANEQVASYAKALAERMALIPAPDGPPSEVE